MAAFVLGFSSCCRHWPKSLEYFYLALRRRGLLILACIEITWVFEQMLAWLINRTVQRFGKCRFCFLFVCLFYSPPCIFSWAGRGARLLVSIQSELGDPAFGKDLGRTKIGVEWGVLQEMEPGDGGVLVVLGPSAPQWLCVLLIRLPLCGWGLVPHADLVIPLASPPPPSHLRRVVEVFKVWIAYI